MKKSIISIVFIFIGVVGLISCEKSDPFVDRVVSPVLVLVESLEGGVSNGLTTDPAVSALVSKDASVMLKVLELDKSGLLDYKIGIDSIPVQGVAISFKLRSGALLQNVNTDSKGVATLSAPWASLGVSSPKAGTTVRLMATGTYKEQSFTKYFTITGK